MSSTVIYGIDNEPIRIGPLRTGVAYTLLRGRQRSDLTTARAKKPKGDRMKVS